MSQNHPKFHFYAFSSSDSIGKLRSRCETVFAFPPAKADIATAILTNVIEHLVLVFRPNKHAFTAEAVWADLAFSC